MKNDENEKRVRGGNGRRRQRGWDLKDSVDYFLILLRQRD